MKEQIAIAAPATAVAAGQSATTESITRGIMAACAGEPASKDAREVPEFVTQETLLTLVPISRRTVFDWRKKGKLPAIQISDKLLFHWPSVRDALLRQQTGGGGQ